jgi:predicted small secreted protein
MAIAHFKNTIVVVLLAFALAGCETTGGPGPKATVGAVGGAAVGGLMAAGLGKRCHYSRGDHPRRSGWWCYR